MGVEVFGGQYLSASGAYLAVQLSCYMRHCGGYLPGVLLVLVLLSSCSSGLFLQGLTVSVGCQQLLLLTSVWQEHQQLAEDAVKIISEQVLTAAVILCCCYHILGSKTDHKEMSKVGAGTNVQTLLGSFSLEIILYFCFSCFGDSKKPFKETLC